MLILLIIPDLFQLQEDKNKQKILASIYLIKIKLFFLQKNIFKGILNFLTKI